MGVPPAADIADGVLIPMSVCELKRCAAKVAFWTDRLFRKWRLLWQSALEGFHEFILCLRGIVLLV